MSDENPEDKITREKSYIFFREKKRVTIKLLISGEKSGYCTTVIKSTVMRNIRGAHR